MYGQIYGSKTTVWRVGPAHLDHIFPRNWLRQFQMEPNVNVNLVSLCERCHGRKKRAENALYAGNAISYVQELNTLGWPMDRVMVSAQYYGLREIVRLIQPRPERTP